MTLVKICGITNLEDALAAVELGADFIGFVLADSPRRADVGEVQRIVSAIRGGDAPASEVTAKKTQSVPTDTKSVAFVGVFVDESEDVIRTMDKCNLDFAQLHGGQSEEFARRIGGQRVIRVARVQNQESVHNITQYSEAKYYLLDTYKKGVAGGTGETFDWELAVRAKSLSKPVILSGGLTPENVFDAVKTVRPYAVDISSGVEISPGKKDRNRIKELIENVRAADNAS